MYGICTLSVVICIPEGKARGNTYNYTKGTNPYTHVQKPMVQLTCTMIQLANVSETVGGPLATAKALVVLATIHPRVHGKMKGCARVYGE